MMDFYDGTIVPAAGTVGEENCVLSFAHRHIFASGFGLDSLDAAEREREN